MCYNWYTRRNVIRTFREGIQRQALVAFQVIDHDLQMIIINLDGIDEGLDDVPAKERILPVTFVEPAEEEENTVPVDQLGLGVTERFDGDAESFRGVLKFLQLDGSGGVPNPGGDGIIYVLIRKDKKWHIL